MITLRRLLEIRQSRKAIYSSFALSIVGQVLLQRRDHWQLGVVLYGVGLFLFLFGTRGERPRSERAESPTPPLIANKRIRWPLACLALLLGVVTFATAGDNRFRWYTIVAWVGACGTWFLGFVERPRWVATIQGWRDADGILVHLRWRYLVLLGILLLAAWFRFYRLDELPGEMTIDHPHKLLDIRDVLQGRYRVFFPRNTGRELFQFYYTAMLVHLGLPLGFETLKVGAVLVSLAAVGVTYALSSELFGPEAGLLAALLLAISRWDLGISRIGLRYPFASLPMAATGLFLFRTLRAGRRTDALWCGLSLGLGLYGYSSFRVVPALVVVAVLLKVLRDREGVRRIGQRRFWANAALILVLAALVFVPLGRYMLDNPTVFWYRVLTRASGLERRLPTDLTSVFLSNVANSLLAFNWRGDVGWVHLVHRLPFLDPITGAFFVLGVGAAIWRSVRYREWRSACLLLGLPILLLPSSLSLAFPIENPSANRSSVAIPLVFTLVGLAPGLLLRTSWGEVKRLTRMATITCLILLLIAAGYLNYQSYFVGYAAQFDTQAWNASELARVISGFTDTYGGLDQVYIAPWPYFVDGRAVAFELGDWEWYNLLNDMTALQDQAAQPGSKLYLVHASDQESLKRLQEMYPQAQVRFHRSAVPDHGFWIVFVPDCHCDGAENRDSIS